MSVMYCFRSRCKLNCPVSVRVVCSNCCAVCWRWTVLWWRFFCSADSTLGHLRWLVSFSRRMVSQCLHDRPMSVQIVCITVVHVSACCITASQDYAFLRILAVLSVNMICQCEFTNFSVNNLTFESVINGTC